MATGTVKSFKRKNGYGFIAPDSGGPDAFAHYSAIDMPGYRALEEGARVQFDLVEGPKGLMAVNILVTEPAPPRVARPRRAVLPPDSPR